MTFVWLMFAHWVGDFLLQTSEMATGKSKSFKWLTIHVFVYSAVILIVSIILFGMNKALPYTILNLLVHWGVDFFTSKLAAHYHEKPRVFYPVIGFDQFLHATTLYLTYLNIDLIAGN